MLTIITLPTNFTSDIGSTTTDLLSAFSPVTVLIVGTLLGAVIVEIIIHAIRKPN
jgi:hypothetical protein